LQESGIFQLIRTIELFTNETIIRWSKAFPYNASVPQILVLFVLLQKGARKQSELANELGYTPGAMTNIATGLIKEKYAERVYDESDRRIVRLEITDKGKEILVQAQKTGHEMREQLFSVLTEDEVQQYLAIQQKLLRNMQQN